jgi:hypothetical protein
MVLTMGMEGQMYQAGIRLGEAKRSRISAYNHSLGLAHGLA